MLRQHATLLSILLAFVFYGIASMWYPGGADGDIEAAGFHWHQNYICNLMSEKAVNGEANPLYWLARLGVAILAAGAAWFYYNHSRKVADRNSAVIIRYAGIGSMAATALVFAAHDFFNNIAIVLSMLAYFYMVVNLFTERERVLGWIGAIMLVLFYAIVLIYFTSQFLFLLPALQKLVLLGILSWVLGLEYGYKAERVR